MLRPLTNKGYAVAAVLGVVVSACGAAALARRSAAAVNRVGKANTGLPGRIDSANGTTDFEYRCVVVDSTSTEDRVAELPPGLRAVDLGQTLYVEFWATDVGTTNTGIVSAYADLEYPEYCVSWNRTSQSDLFSLFGDGTDEGSFIDELGGSQLDANVGVAPEWVRVAEVEFLVTATCASAEFSLAPAQTESAAHTRGLVPSSDIEYHLCTVVTGAPGIPAVSRWGIVTLGILALSSATVLLRQSRHEDRRSS